MKFTLLMALLFFSFISLAQSTSSNEIANGTSFNSVAKGDTITAVQNLFQRKRAGSRTGTVIFGLLTGSSIATGISSGLAGNFLLAGVFGILTISNISKGKKYNDERLELIISDYQKSKVLPPDIRKRLKNKDFK